MSISQGTVYGRLPGVKVHVVGGGLSTTQIGREQKLVYFGRGDATDGSAEPNDPTQIQTRVDAGRVFGRGTQLADAVEKGLRNKGNIDYIYGVMCEETDVQAEPITGGTGNLQNFPIVEDFSYLTVTDTISTDEMEVEFRYEEPPEAPAESGTVAINPLTGSFEAGDTNDYEVDYAMLNWQAALDAADTVLNHSEVGIYAPLSDSVEVAQMLENKLHGSGEDPGIRHEYKLISGVVGAQPNMTTENGEPGINPAEYDDPIDADAVFMPGPVRLEGEPGRTVLGGIAGIMAGNQLENPIYGDNILGYDRLTQALTRDEEDLMRERNTIPIVDDYRDGAGGISIEGHQSTSTATDWYRSFQNRRVTDVVILVQREIGEAARDNLMRDRQLDEIEAQIIDTFEQMARAGLIRGNPDRPGPQPGDDAQEEEDDPYFAEVVRLDNQTIGIASGFSPVGVITGVDQTITVADEVEELATATMGAD